MFRCGTVWMGSCLVAAVLAAALFSSEARSACPLGLTGFEWLSKPLCQPNRPQIVNLKSCTADELIRICSAKPGEPFKREPSVKDVDSGKEYSPCVGRPCYVSPQVDIKGQPEGSQVVSQVEVLPVHRVGQIIIVGNDIVGQVRIVPRVSLYPGQILSNPDSGTDAGKGHERNQGGESRESAPEAVTPDAHDEIEFPFLGAEVLRESREMSILFDDLRNPYIYEMMGSIVVRKRLFEEKQPLFPAARDPLALSSDWEFPEILDEARALRDQSRLFGGPGFREYQVFYSFFVGEGSVVPEPKPPRIVRAPNFGEWHARLRDPRFRLVTWPETGSICHHEPIQAMERHFDEEPAQDFGDCHIELREARTGCLLFGVGVNSDAGLTGGIVLNERNFDVPPAIGCDPEVGQEIIPGTQTPWNSISFTPSNLQDKPVYFRFGFAYYRLR
jgi:hypothetical protein